MNDFIVSITNHHINPKYILTPIAISAYNLNSGVLINCVYLFGIRIFRTSILK